MTGQPTSWAIECPTCGAAPARACQTGGGNPVSTEHAARKALAMVTAHTTLDCGNCGQPIYEHGKSPTGYTHRATDRARCDAKPSKRATFHLHALAIPATKEETA